MGFVGFVGIMLILHVYMFVFHFYTVYYVLCCVVHTMFMIKNLLDVFMCLFGSIECEGCKDNHVSLFLKHQMIMCFYTLP